MLILLIFIFYILTRIPLLLINYYFFYCEYRNINKLLSNRVGLSNMLIAIYESTNKNVDYKLFNFDFDYKRIDLLDSLLMMTQKETKLFIKEIFLVCFLPLVDIITLIKSFNYYKWQKQVYVEDYVYSSLIQIIRNNRYLSENLRDNILLIENKLTELDKTFNAKVFILLNDIRRAYLETVILLFEEKEVKDIKISDIEHIGYSYLETITKLHDNISDKLNIEKENENYAYLEMEQKVKEKLNTLIDKVFE